MTTESYTVKTTVEVREDGEVIGYEDETVYEGNNFSLARSIVEQDKYAEMRTWKNGVCVSRTFQSGGSVKTFTE